MPSRAYVSSVAALGSFGSRSMPTISPMVSVAAYPYCVVSLHATAPHFGEYRDLPCIRESFHSAESIDVVLLLEDLHSRQVLCSSLALLRK